MYNYIIIKENNESMQRESVLTHNKYLKSKKYAYICKGVHKDGSESIYFIEYSNDIELLQKRANEYVSWYNYPLGLSKSINGYISELP
jgi:hypothetical protein